MVYFSRFGMLYQEKSGNPDIDNKKKIEREKRSVKKNVCREFCNFPQFHFLEQTVSHRVARWFIFKPKIPIWVYFRGPWYGKCW
jgi:hypothetical protein